MDTNGIPSRLRAADTDRERVASLIQAAGGEGRLSLEEVEERLGTVYSTKYTDELEKLTSDLPKPAPKRRPVAFGHPAVRIHVAIAVVLSVLVIARWTVSGVPFFWPAMPMFWLAMSVLVHARVRGARRGFRRGDGVVVA
ncbi:DUF1707 SHOCT-like domain-containing protein [Amycolatopsis regifaucium]|uniref:DUF1707 domain-containing protein n=1 Tax=Amycolatopsis regifaucium TaxID=546365 RepID=A0A154MC14_9PSEU|nr:DUF1707 domain-containing protein [Amycolatopsis regifaucium]KZB82148.1 hypothetical protein AVL48_09415 [Amycolatopsis regifaucium]OKA05781.1 hypothetical protein ATP06_0221575 [Amycolatopsis regifaucium]SFG84140.1 protein of unknown function [Amycolatopsis regifaucium]